MADRTNSGSSRLTDGNLFNRTDYLSREICNILLNPPERVGSRSIEVVQGR